MSSLCIVRQMTQRFHVSSDHITIKHSEYKQIKNLIMYNIIYNKIYEVCIHCQAPDHVQVKNQSRSILWSSVVRLDSESIGPSLRVL